MEMSICTRLLCRQNSRPRLGLPASLPNPHLGSIGARKHVETKCPQNAQNQNFKIADAGSDISWRH